MRIMSVIGTYLDLVAPRIAQRARKEWRRANREWARRRPGAPWTKADLINHLADARGYRYYLEVCTPTSGGRYAEIKRSKFASCLRLMYRCPESYHDGMAIDYRITDLDITECLTRMRDDARRVDIALLDSFHEYEQSLRDLTEGFGLISEGGTLVVHDCMPPRVEIAQPKFMPGEWSGATYEAFIDFVSNRSDLEFYTVDTDYGCGIIHKQSAGAESAEAASSIDERNERNQALANWQAQRDISWQAAFSFFEEHKEVLLDLISLDEFLAKNPKPRGGLWKFTTAR
jgi:hypothetical protein